MTYPQWLTEFFQNSKIRLDGPAWQTYDYETRKALNNFLEPIRQKKNYFALPYVNSLGQVLLYAGGVADERELKELFSLLRASLGSSYITEYQVLTSVDEDNTTQFLLKRFPIGVIRLELFAGLDKYQVRQCFELTAQLIHILNRRPALVHIAKRPTGRILRDFYLAQEQKDAVLARQCFEEIKSSLGLGAKNLVFLDIQALAIGQQWQEILEHQQLKDLIDSLLPPSLLHILLEALWQTNGNQLATLQVTSHLDMEGLQRQYRYFKPIFTRLPQIRKDPQFGLQWQQWAVGAILLGEHRYFEHLPECVDIQWCSKVAELVSQHTEKNSEQQSIAHFNLTVPKNIEQVKVYLNHCVSQSPEYWQEFWAYLEQIPVNLRVLIEQTASLKVDWERVEAYCNKKSTYGWQHWFDQLMQSTNLNDEQFLLKLHSEHSLWPLQSFNEQQLIMVLKTENIDQKNIVRNSIPILLEWLQQNNIKLVAKTILRLFSLIVEDEKIYPNDLLLAYALLEYWKTIRESDEFDQNIMVNLTMLWEKCGNILTHQRALKIVDLLNLIEGFNIFEVDEFKRLINQSLQIGA